MTEGLRAALKEGNLTESQLRELIALRAELLGLTFDEAVEAFREGTLPRSAQGADLALLIGMIDAVPA